MHEHIEQKSDFYSTFADFFNFEFVDRISLKNSDPVAHLNIPTWDIQLLLKHISLLKEIKSDKKSVNNTLDTLELYYNNDQKNIRHVSEIDNMCMESPELDLLRKKDDENHYNKILSMKEIEHLHEWFDKDRDSDQCTKMRNLVKFWMYEKDVSTYKYSSEKIARTMSVLEDEIILDRLKGQINKDPGLLPLLHKKKHIFDALTRENENSKVTESSESYFRKSRASWPNLNPTPGFEGCDFHNYDKMRKISIYTSGDFRGFTVDEISDSAPTKEVDIATVDPNLHTKLTKYLAENPSFQSWKKFVSNEFIPGSALFFRPYVLQPSENTKPAFFATIDRKPTNCFDRNLITEQGINMTFYILTWSDENAEWYLGSQIKLETKNSTQRRRLILEKNQSVLATQLPGKKNIDANFFNTIYYGGAMKSVDLDDGKIFE